MAPMTFLPILPRPSTRPMVVVDLPSPSGVGVMAVTSTYLPSGRSLQALEDAHVVELGHVVAVGQELLLLQAQLVRPAASPASCRPPPPPRSPSPSSSSDRASPCASPSRGPACDGSPIVSERPVMQACSTLQRPLTRRTIPYPRRPGSAVRDPVLPQACTSHAARATLCCASASIPGSRRSPTPSCLPSTEGSSTQRRTSPAASSRTRLLRGARHPGLEALAETIAHAHAKGLPGDPRRQARGHRLHGGGLREGGLRRAGTRMRSR